MPSSVLSRRPAAASKALSAQAASKNSSDRLAVGAPDTAFEREAEDVADRVMAGGASLNIPWSISRMSIGSSVQRKCSCGGSGECEKCKADEEGKKGDHPPVQRKAEGARRSADAPAIVHQVLQSPGQPLDRSTQGFFESRLGHDFSGVRIHTDGAAAESARSVEALAYTAGKHVVFASGSYSPDSADGRKLLAHELVHSVQQGAIGSRTVQRKSTGPGWTGSAKGTLNETENPVGNIRRIPIEDLQEGNQQDNAAKGEESAKGRAIVLLNKKFDVKKPADILLFFHGHNEGFRKGSQGFRDRDMYQIEQQIDGAGKEQLIGILPQGTRDSAFGAVPAGTTPTSCNKIELKKAFNSDAYISEVFDTLISLSIWAAKPPKGSVLISGHSGGGELINQGLLGGGAGSSLPQKLGTLKEVSLIDAINGPCEFLGVTDWLQKTLTQELADLKGKSNAADQQNYLKTSIRFRSYFERSKSIGNFYSQWNIGPLPSLKLVAGKKPLQDLLKDWFSGVTGLPQTIVDLWKANYAIVDMGKVAHDDDKTANITMAPTPSGSTPLTESINVLPKREPAARSLAPGDVTDVVSGGLQSPSRVLGDDEKRWARGHFGQDFSHVRVHADRQAAESAKALRSLAYTVGRHIVVDPHQYRPETPDGRRLLGHELTHVLQQGSADPFSRVNARFRLGPADHALEREADRGSESGGPVVGHPSEPGRVVQRMAAEGKLAKDVCETTKNPTQEQIGECNYARPENCPTYETWIETFARLKTFAARATPSPGTITQGTPNRFDVLGDEPATRFPDTPVEKEMAKDPKSAPFPTTGLKLGETFIDHPTDTWVKTCLPDNLRATAYQLPADCADIAIILRHCWLSAHHRTQIIQVGSQTWTIGDASGGSARLNALKAISDIGSETVTALVAPYSDAQGNPLLAFKDLEPLLHPGDILVWEHRDKGLDKGRTGGHALTITAVNRKADGKIESMSFLQGNEPIFGDTDCKPAEKDASGLCPGDDKGRIIQQLKIKDTKANRDELGHAPGRRIEAATTTDPTQGITFNHPDIEVPSSTKGVKPSIVWGWGTNTILLAAGPPKAAKRPPAAKPAKGAQPERHLADWAKSFAGAASDADWQAVWEAMLLEARAFVEGGRVVAESDARQAADAAGQRFWTLAKQPAGTLGDETHFRRLEAAKGVIHAVGQGRKSADATTTTLLQTLQWIEDSLDLAARGVSDISFSGGKSTVKVLLTGFDPFDPSGSLKLPPRGTWNPSGAAVLALDNQTIPAKSSKGTAGSASVQGVILPVSYDKFQAGGKGLVESIVTSKAADLDAAITVSMDPGIEAAQPVRLERYVVGTHDVPGKGLAAIPAAGGGTAGDAILESNAPLAQIATDTELKSKDPAKSIPKPAIGETITFRFADAATAKGAAMALSGAVDQFAPTDVTVSDEKAIHEITSSMVRQTNGIDIKFKAGGKDFTATVVQGPGGNFLSNEVSYRMLRLLRDKKFPQDPLSFHVHTQGAAAIPQEQADKPESKKARADAWKSAAGLLSRLVDTLKRIISATAKVILDRRASKGSSKP